MCLISFVSRTRLSVAVRNGDEDPLAPERNLKGRLMLMRYNNSTQLTSPAAAVIRRTAFVAAAAVATAITPVSAQEYTITNLGMPPGADTVFGAHMNNDGHVVGWSIFYGQLDSLKGWIWTPQGGFTMLPTPPGMPWGRFAAQDISDTGIIAGDGGGDTGQAWRFENGSYTIIDLLPGTGGAKLGGVNRAGDITGTGFDGSIRTPDVAWVDANGGALVNLTPGTLGGRGVDINNFGQVCGYSQGPNAGFEAFLWDEINGQQFLGTFGLAMSFANRMNDLGQVIGYARSGTGSTRRNWIYTDGIGMQEIPMRGAAAAVNNHGVVVGWQSSPGPSLAWIWSETHGGVFLGTMFDFVAAGISGTEARDINDAGQILVHGYDNNAGEFRSFVMTPISASCYADCDQSTGAGVLDIFDFLCFQNSFVNADPYACDCDTSTGPRVCDVFDFLCFQNSFVAGCP
jgi:uncharacterized membrane protein